MNCNLDTILLGLADHTEVIHQALEGKNLTFEDRMIYLGHLAMCARIFKAVYLGESSRQVLAFIRIEQSAFKLGTPSDERGIIARQSWTILKPLLEQYLAIPDNKED